VRRLIALSLVILLSSGCAVGPNYKRPSANVPGTYRGTMPQAAPQPAAESLGDQRWWEVFQDKQLQDLIHTALQQNYDARIAATRILEAQAQVGITRADGLPTISAGAQSVDQRSARQKFFPAFDTSAHQVDVSLAWDLDFWGKYRRANESARATLLATQWAREAVITTLVGDVAAAYFQLRELDLQLEISRRTLTSRQNSLQLTQVLAKGGATSMLDVRQAEQLVFTAAETIPDLERHQHTSGKQPRSHCARSKVDGATACARGSGGASLHLARAATGHSPGRSTIDRGQRSNWSSESSLLPANQFDGERRISEFSAYQSVYRSGRVVEFRRITGTAHLRRRKNSFRGEILRSSATGNTTDLPADHPAGLPWRFGRAGRVSQGPRVPRAAGATRVFR
jgi:Outer membrane efflux protein